MSICRLIEEKERGRDKTVAIEIARSISVKQYKFEMPDVGDKWFWDKDENGNDIFVIVTEEIIKMAEFYVEILVRQKDIFWGIQECGELV